MNQRNAETSQIMLALKKQPEESLEDLVLSRYTSIASAVRSLSDLDFLFLGFLELYNYQLHKRSDHDS